MSNTSLAIMNKRNVYGLNQYTLYRIMTTRVDLSGKRVWFTGQFVMHGGVIFGVFRDADNYEQHYDVRPFAVEVVR